MIAKSPFWNEKEGVCEKHFLPSVPCPDCMSAADEDVEFIAEPNDVALVEIDQFSGESTTLKDLVPANFTNPNIRVGDDL